MKKHLLSILNVIVCMFAALTINAQSWKVYDASVLPDQSTPAFAVTNTGGPSVANNGSYLVSDPDIQDNSLLEFRVDSALSKVCWGNSWGIKPAQGATIIFKAKALDAAVYPYVLEFEMRTGVTRERVIISSNGNVKLNQANITQSVSNVDEWNIYRITYRNDSVKVYINENPTALLSGVTPTANTSNDFRFGDGSATSGNNYGALIDWVMWDTTGAFIPGKGAAIPEDISLACGTNKGNIFFVTNPATINLQTSVQGDVASVTFLRIQGYDVTTGYPTDANWSYSALDKANVVIIGRAIASADFGGKDSTWAKVKAPVMMLSQYAAQSTRLKMFKIAAVLTDTTFTGTLKAKVIDPADPVFSGITLTNGDTLDYSTGSYTVIKQGKDTLNSAGNNAMLVASVANGVKTGHMGAVLIARWAPGVETYTGSKVFPSSNWTYFGIGDDQKKIGGVTKITNFFCFTEQSKKLFVNEINSMIRTSQKIFFVTNVAVKNNQTGKYADSLTVDALKKAGYQVATGYMTETNWSYAALNGYNVVIIGRGIASADFGGKDSTWAAVKAPLMMLSQYAAQSTRLKMFKIAAVLTDTTWTGNLKAKISDPNDPVFNGVNLINGDTLEYSTGSYTVIKQGSDTLNSAGNNAILVAKVANGVKTGHVGAVLIARWKPGVETYTGSKVKPVSNWSYFGIGDDQKKIGGVTKITNFFQFTDESKQVWLNEIAYLIGTSAGVDTTPPHIPSTIATIDTIFYGNDTIAIVGDVVNYAVELPAGTTVVPTVTAVLTDTTATTKIVAASSLPGNTIIQVTAEDGITKKTYKVSFTVISNDATLKALTSGGIAVPGFNASTITYNIELPAGTTAIPVVAGTTNNINATVVVTPPASLPGSTTVLVTAEDGSTTKTYTISFTVAVSVTSLNSSIIRLYPQPANDVLCISLTEEFSDASITFFNVIGQPVLSQSLKGSNPSINVSNLQPGSYFIAVSKGAAVWTSKILIK